MRKFFGILCMLLGLAMLAGSGWLLYQNYAEDQDAGIQSESALVELRDEIAAVPRPTMTAIPRTEPTPEPILGDDGEPLPAVEDELLPAATLPPEMPTMVIKGRDYIGYLEMPTIGISLPVMSDWSYPQLRVAPCRYRGSAYEDNMVIMAHNYDRHFGRVTSLNIGDPVQFIDAQGNIFKYVVAAHETLERTDVKKMIENDYDLTLFTCTYGGENRITVRLERVLAY